MSDYLAAMVTALTNGWNPANAGSRTPKICKIFEYTDWNLSVQDFIGCYSGDESEEALYIGYTGNKREIALSFNISTAVSHAQLILMVDEARRVVHAARKTLVTNSVWKWKRALDVSDKRRGTFKYVIDTQIIIPGEVI